MPWNKTDRSFKTLINKRVTDSDAKFYFNEKGDFTINTHQLELWVDDIPSTAPGSTTDIVEYHNTLTLVEDTSVPNKQTWFATSNSSTVPAQTDEDARLKNWISDKYGSTYEVVLYDGSDVQIPPSDGCGWFFDYQTGILTFASTTTTTGGGGSLSSRAPFKLQGYRYIGRTGLDGNIIKNEVRLATTPATSFSGWTYVSELIDTGVTSTTLTIDGVNLNTVAGFLGDRVLIKDWSTLSNNGIYYVERVGDGASDTWRFRRAPDFNDTEDVFPGTMVFVRSGTVNARSIWSMSNSSFTTLDAGGASGEITFAQFVATTTRWSSLTAPSTNLSLGMSTNTTVFNWATGTSTNNLFSLTTDASSNGTGVLLNVATGASSTVVPFRVRRDTTDYLTVNATGGVLVGNLSSSRVVYAGASGLLQDSSNFTFDGSRISLATTGSSGGLLIGGDANLYRSAADTLKTDDSLVVGVNLSVLNAGTFSLYESGSGNFSSFGAGSQSADLRYTLPTSQPSTNQVLTATSISGSGPYDITLSWVTNSASITIGDTVNSGTAGSILFVGSGPVLSQDNSNLYWDDTNNTLGVGTTRTGAISGTNPSVRIKGTGATSGTSSLEIQDSAADTLFLVRNDGKILIGTNASLVADSILEAHLDQNADTSFAIHNTTSGTSATSSLRLYSAGGYYGHIKSTSDLFNAPSDWAEAFVIEAHTLHTAGLWLSAYTNTITLTTTATNAYDLRIGENGAVGFGLAPSAHIHAGRNLTLNAWGVAGSGFRFDAATYTDDTSSGTVASAVAHGIARPTFASASTTTYTDAATLYLANSPANGANVTITNAYALWVDSGVVRLDDNVQVRTLSSGRVTYAGTNGVLTDSSNMTFDGNRLSLTATGSSGGVLIGGDAQLYRSAADVLRTPDSLTVDVNLTVSGTASVGAAGGTTGTLNLVGSTSGTISVLAQAAAGTYNFNLPTTAGSSGHVLTSGGGGGSAMTWTDPASLAVRWNSIVAPNGNQSLSMSTNTTTWNWATGTSTNNLVSLTTDSSANGTGALLRLATGTSSTVLPLLVSAGAATALTVNASGQVLVGTLTSTRLTYAGSSGLLTDSANLTFDGSRVSIAVTGSSGGLLLGGDANLYRSAADTLKTDDSFVVGVNLSILNAGTFSLYESGSGNFSSFTAGSQAADLRYTLPTSQPSTNQVLTATSISGSGPYDIALGWSTPSAGIAIGSTITGGTEGSVLFLGASSVLAQDNSNFFWDDTNNYLGLGASATPAARLHIAGNQSASAWLVSGIGLRVDAATFTDTSSSGTVTAISAHAIAQPTFAASTSTTYTGAATLYVANAPASGTNVSITNAYALWIDSGISRFDGSVQVQTLSSGRVTYAGTSGVLQDSSNMTFDGSKLSLAATGSSGGLLIGGDVALYRASANVLQTDDSVIIDGSLDVIGIGGNVTVSNGYLISGESGAITGAVQLLGDSDGTVTIQPQSSAGTYNFNLPTTAGSSGHVLTSGGGGATAMTWTDPASLAVRWNSIVAPNGNQSLSMSTRTTTWNWATGTSTNNLFSLTTDASADGTGALLRIATGASSTVLPLLISAGAATALTVNASGQVLVGTLTSTRLTYAGSSGLLTDSANLTFDGSRVSIAVTGSSGGLLIGGDANLYRSAADTLKTDDSLVVAVNLTVNSLTSTRVPFASTSGLLVDSSAFTYTTGTGQLSLSTSGSSAGLLLGGDALLYRSAADVLRTPDSLTVDVNLTVSGTASVGAAGGTTGTLNLVGSTSGTISVLAQAAAGTYNFNLPTTAGSSGHVLTSGGGGASAMTWTDPASLAVRWNSIVAPNGNQSLSMSTNTTTWNWATGTSTNNLVSLTTDASADGTGALLRLATGASSTVLPLLVSAGAATALTVNASGQVLVGTLTSTRLTYAGSSGLLTDSANLTFDGSRVSIAVTGSAGGLLIGGDANLYRSAADTLKTDDSLVVGVNLTVNSLTSTRVPFASTSGLLVDSSAFTYTTGTGQLSLSTSGSSAGLLLGGDALLYRSAADVLRTPDSLTVDVNLTVSGTASVGAAGGTTGTLNLVGSTSGTISVLAQAAAGTYNFNLPTTAGSSGHVLTSAGGGASAMTWTDPASLAVRWNSIVAPNGNQSLSMSTNTTTWNWATGTSTNNLVSLTTDSSANGTGALLRLATGTSATVLPLLVSAGAVTALTVNASGQVLIGTLTSTRVPFAGTSGLLTDSSSFTYTTGTGQLALATTGSGAGVLIGGDTQIYRDAADILRTPDSMRIDAYLGIGAAPSSGQGLDAQRTISSSINYNNIRSVTYITTNITGGFSINGFQNLVYIQNGIASGPSNFVTAGANQLYIQGAANNVHYAVGLAGDVRMDSNRTGGTIATAGGAVVNLWLAGNTGGAVTTGFGGRFDLLATSSTSAGSVGTGYGGLFRVGAFDAAATTTFTTLSGITVQPFQGAGTITTFVGFEMSNWTTGAGALTTAYGVKIGTFPNFSANGQTRIGIDIDAIPSNDGSYSTTTAVALRFSTGSRHQRNGIRWGTDTSSNIWSNASNELTTDGKWSCGSLRVGTSSTSGQALCASDSSGNVTFQTVIRKRSLVATLCGGFTPSATGGDVFEFTLPYSPVDGTTSITWNMRRITLRVNVAGGAPAVTIEKSTATGAFSATTMGSVTMGSGNYEVSATSGFSSSTVASGDKIRMNPTALGTATGWTVTVLFEEN